MVRSIAAVLGPACGMALSVACCLQGTPRAAAAPHLLNPSLSLKQVEAAQQAWCQALLLISADYERGGLAKAKATASAVIDQSYAYQYGPVAFKPTLASGQQTFRPTRAGALAYFVGNDPAFPGDSGFALKGWRGCKVDNEVVQLRGTLAITMGKVILTDAKGKTTTVDKTWVFEREPDCTIRIVVHHSSLPFSG